jgi:hypothetical protein
VLYLENSDKDTTTVTTTTITSGDYQSELVQIWNEQDKERDWSVFIKTTVAKQGLDCRYSVMNNNENNRPGRPRLHKKYSNIWVVKFYLVSAVSQQQSVTVQHFITCSKCGREVKDLTYKRANDLMREHYLYFHMASKYDAVVSFGFL